MKTAITSLVFRQPLNFLVAVCWLTAGQCTIYSYYYDVLEYEVHELQRTPKCNECNLFLLLWLLIQCNSFIWNLVPTFCWIYCLFFLAKVVLWLLLVTQTFNHQRGQWMSKRLWPMADWHQLYATHRNLSFCSWCSLNQCKCSNDASEERRSRVQFWWRWIN